MVLSGNTIRHRPLINVSGSYGETERRMEMMKAHTQRGTPLSTQGSGPLEDGSWPPGHYSDKCCSRRC